MIGIKRLTMNQEQLNMISTHRLATHVIVRGTMRQKKVLCNIISQIALVPVSATGIIMLFIS